MLLTLYKAVSYLWKRENALDSQSHKLEDDTKCTVLGKDCGNECNIHGTVTKVNAVGGYGLVEGVIYFTLNLIPADVEINVGDTVFVQAVRDSVQHGWKAISLTLCKNDWETADVKQKVTLQELSHSILEENTSVLHEGKVKACYSTFSVLDNDCHFLISNCTIDFVPIPGDFIQGVVSPNDSRKWSAWRPKCVKKVEGIITSIETECGFINEEIIFFFSSLKCKYSLCCNQRVDALVLDSDQNLFKLRAFAIVPHEKSELQDKKIKQCLSYKEGFDITPILNFRTVEYGSDQKLEVEIGNSTSNPVYFIGCNFQKPKERCPFYICEENKNQPSVLQPGCKLNLKIGCHATSVGHDCDNLIIEFEDFTIRRMVDIKVVHQAQAMLGPCSTFSRAKPKLNQEIYEPTDREMVYVPGEKLVFPKANFNSWNQPQYHVPHNMWRIIKCGLNLSQALPVLSEELKIGNYVKKFDHLLFLEEIQMCLDMREFDMPEVILQRKGDFLTLEVPGLAEGRPSLLIGDKALLSAPENTARTVYEAYIHDVSQSRIYLKFNQNFQSSYNGESYDVIFKFNRSNLRRYHECIRSVTECRSPLLFPTILKLQKPLVSIFDSKNNFKPNSVKWCNEDLNFQQKFAIGKILESRARPLPYIVFGPPGTGKTVTIVEAVLQIYSMSKASRILICTPSNSAADLIALKLVQSQKVGTKDFVRLNSYQRNADSVPDFIKPYCQDKNSLESVVMFRIIISTCTTAGAFSNLEMSNNHFTHIFFDEAAQLTEPEVMVTMSVIKNNRNACVIMAGDPQQLGPVLRSKWATAFGLEIPYIERIMQLPLYERSSLDYHQTNGYNPSLVTMLTNTYRMHPYILSYPSEKFYFNQIQCCVSEERHAILGNWECLPQKGFPVIFHGVNGEEFREENSPSWFNPAEIVEITMYLQKLYNYGLKPADVGIISPYKKQVEKIRVMIAATHLEACKIGSVEEFQGQERRAIIISTVRSCRNLVDFDVIHNLGFLSNPKRLNVAITRAKELLIVVGNPIVLTQDYFWDGFISYCHSKGGHTGFFVK